MFCKIDFLFIFESAPLIDLRLKAYNDSIERGGNIVESGRHKDDTFQGATVFSTKEYPSSQTGRKTVLPDRDDRIGSAERLR